MQQTAQKCPGCDDNTARDNPQAQISFDAHRLPVLHKDSGNRCLLEIEILCPFQDRLHPKLISLLVALDPWCTNGWTLGPVKHPELNPCRVGVEAHCATHGIDLANYMPLGQAPDRWIARHLANRVQVLGQHQRPASNSGRSQCRFDAGMAAADHCNVVFCRQFKHFD